MDGLETLGLTKHVEHPFSQNSAWIINSFQQGSLYTHLSFVHVSPGSEIEKRPGPFS